VPALSIVEIDTVSRLTSPLTWELPLEKFWTLDRLPTPNSRSKAPDFSKATQLTPVLTWELAVFDSCLLNGGPRRKSEPDRQSPAGDSGLTRELSVFERTKSAPLLLRSTPVDATHFSEAPPVTRLAEHGESRAMLTGLGYAR
jgi:hypothetical protein